MPGKSIVAITEVLSGHTRIMVDTAPIIYFIEENKRFKDITEGIFSRGPKSQLFLFSSVITLIEVLTYPLKKGNTEIARKYEDFLVHSQDFTLFQIDSIISKKAAELRARYGIKTPDAIQLAVACENNGSLFITNDKELKKIEEIEILVLDDLA